MCCSLQEVLVIKIIQKKWFYDLRTNMQNFGKTNQLKESHFDDFVKAYTAENREEVQDERWNKFTREEIKEKNNNLDLGLIKMIQS